MGGMPFGAGYFGQYHFEIPDVGPTTAREIELLATATASQSLTATATTSQTLAASADWVEG